MIIPYILDTQPPALIAGYEDFRMEMAAYLGYGDEPELWTEQQRAELKRSVQEAYRYILYPSRIPGGGPSHTWSWLRRWTTLSTTADTWEYTLPTDFGAMNSRYLTYNPETGFAPVQKTSVYEIMERRQWSSQSAHPYIYAIRWMAPSGGNSQRQELLFYPTPDGAYTLNYEYSVIVGPIDKRNPYPLGGPRISQLMIEACKAVGEAKKNGQRGDQWAIFRESLADAIQLDAATLTERTVGRMTGQYDDYDRYKPFYGIRSLDGSTYVGVV